MEINELYLWFSQNSRLRHVTIEDCAGKILVMGLDPREQKYVHKTFVTSLGATSWARKRFPLDSTQPQTQEPKTMHNSALILLVDEGMRVIKARYETEGQSEYFKTRDPAIAKGDYVVTQTHSRHKMTVAEVTAVDVNPDLDTVGEIRWIVQRIDHESYKADLAAEETMIDRIQEKKRAEKRAELRKTMIGDFGEDPAATLLAAPEEPST